MKEGQQLHILQNKQDKDGKMDIVHILAAQQLLKFLFKRYTPPIQT